MGTEELVRLEDVWVHYDSVPVLEGINLTIKSNDFLGIIGPNGGGKTTLLKVILGLIKPSRGKVTVMGQPPEKGRRFIGYISQFNLFDRDFPISVFDVVLMGRYSQTGLLRRYTEEDKMAATEALKAVEMLDYKDRQIGRLSGGEQQRVFIARALATNPKLLLLDEPTASIDPDMQAEFYELLDRLKEKMAIVLVSHDISAVSIYVSEIACLNHQLFYHGSKEVSAEELEKSYHCPIQLIAHGTVPHRVLKEH
ncbi:MAG TPA: ABC transporter ATP-binding protein [Dehalococcoidia bacterium]|jgi:zinc transport system ATP-binding protein|nr:ABC transporter ATP-binding protein [Dehalococcoidia bacterium]